MFFPRSPRALNRPRLVPGSWTTYAPPSVPTISTQCHLPFLRDGTLAMTGLPARSCSSMAARVGLLDTVTPNRFFVTAGTAREVDWFNDRALGTHIHVDGTIPASVNGSYAAELIRSLALGIA